MQRPMFFYERFVFVGGRATWNGALPVRLRGPLAPAALETALAELQGRHPELQVGIEIRGRRPWFVTPAHPPPIPVSIVPRHGDDDWLEQARREIERPFPLPDGPLVRLIWMRPEEAGTPRTGTECELILVGHHCVCDGMSFIILMRELLDRLGQPGLPGAPFPELGSFADLPLGPRPMHQLVGRRERAMIALTRLLMPLARLAVRPRRRSPCYVMRWEMDQAVSGILADRCRAHDATPYLAMGAAILRGFLAIRPGVARNRLLCPINIRTLLPGIGSDRMFPHGDSVVLSLDRRVADFWSQVRAMRASFNAKRSDLDPARLLAMGERLHPVSDRLVDLLMRGRVRQDLVFSYMGVPPLPDGEGPLSLVTVPGILSSMPWRDGTVVSVLKSNDRLVFVLVSYEELLPRGEAELIRNHAMAVLAAEVVA